MIGRIIAMVSAHPDLLVCFLPRLGIDRGAGVLVVENTAIDAIQTY